MTVFGYVTSILELIHLILDSIIRACRASGIDAMVRTKPGSHRDLIQPLEMGANGLMLPRVKNADEVRGCDRRMQISANRYAWNRWNKC